VVERTAVRAVLVRDGDVLLLRTRDGHWKLPGGGVEAGETLGAALERELREECGLVDVRVTRPLVTVVELAPAEEPGHTFRMTSHYFRCVGGTLSMSPSLTADERELGLTPTWLTPARALDLSRSSSATSTPRWHEREHTVLRLLAESG
jgi:ADP-ribose pyrophosphatase YjhB (NUDIX family)